ncbi:hypothetical protein D3C76_1481960 [compost metagenome]|uniref:hypothetical protein n=1 Tax=Pseudomonas TaxID=286 RepID=UPI000F964D5E|nr:MULTISPECIES: hypothetical protein [Pseudomonas]MDD2103667.1 hypothetical protein [Pseudomonas putida]MEB2514765.1 hypothetical protein [Pseudomonas sp. YuFO20]
MLGWLRFFKEEANEILKALNAASERFLSRFTRKQFFFAGIAVTAVTYSLAYTVPVYKSLYLAMIGGWLFGMMFASFHPAK